LVIHASMVNWAGDWGWGPRFLLAVIPLACIPAAYAFDRDLASVRLFVIAAVLLQIPGIATNWEYRYLWHRQETGTIPDHWDLGNSQYIDAARTLGRNLQRVAGGVVAPDVVPTAHPMNVYASNHVNVWWLSAPSIGLAPWMAVSVALLLFFSGCALIVFSRLLE
jgi:hypothetical protein